MKYEYKVLDFPDRSSRIPPLSEKCLNEYGEEHWELVTLSISRGQYYSAYQYIFKRPFPDRKAAIDAARKQRVGDVE